jgi:glutaredoxin 3
VVSFQALLVFTSYVPSIQKQTFSPPPNMLAFTTSLSVGLRLGATVAQRCPTHPGRTLATATAIPVSELVSAAIKDHKVMVYSKSRCPYCANAKALLRQELPGGFEVWELDQMEIGREIQDQLLAITGQRTVPNIFINGEHIGGCDDLMDLHSNGNLAKKLVSA